MRKWKIIYSIGNSYFEDEIDAVKFTWNNDGWLFFHDSSGATVSMYKCADIRVLNGK